MLSLQKETILKRGDVMEQMRRVTINEVDKAQHIAYQAHYGQVDKAGIDYFQHCIRVAGFAASYATSEEEVFRLATIGFLHDVIEDTEISLDDLEREISDECILTAIDLLTKKDTETYFDYIENVSTNRLATLVKLADLYDHLIPSQFFELPPSLRTRYKKAQTILKNSLLS